MIAIGGLEEFFEKFDEFDEGKKMAEKKAEEEKKSEFEELMQKADDALMKKKETIDNADKRKHLTEAIEYLEKALLYCREHSKEEKGRKEILWRGASLLTETLLNKVKKELNWLKANFT